MATLTEGNTAGDLILHHDYEMSRFERTVYQEFDLEFGSVIGIVTATGQARAWNPANNDGSEVAYGILLSDVKAANASVSKIPTLEYHAKIRGFAMRLTFQPTSAQAQQLGDHLKQRSIFINVSG